MPAKIYFSFTKINKYVTNSHGEMFVSWQNIMV